MTYGFPFTHFLFWSIVMSRKAKEIVFVMDNGQIATDSRGIALQTLSVNVTRKDKPPIGKKVVKGVEVSIYAKEKHPTQCVHFRAEDISYVDEDQEGVCVTLPESWDMDRFLKALNQGTRLLAQQPVHAKFAPGGEILANRTKVFTFISENPDDADGKAFMTEYVRLCAAGDMKSANAHADRFYEDFIDEETD